jgi:spore coat polysaccharide biosynthesis protein SpsF
MSLERVRVLAILQARTTSTRMPAKSIKPLVGAPMIIRQLERISRARLIDKIVVATSSDPSDDFLADLVQQARISVFRGDLDDVLGRFAATLAVHPGEHVVRLTADCPLTDPDVIDAVIAHHLVCGADLTGNCINPTFPDGLDVEVVSPAALKQAAEVAELNYEREHVTQYFYRRPTQFDIAGYVSRQNLSHHRWTVDYPEDFRFVEACYQELFPTKPDFGYRDVLALLAARPELCKPNAHLQRNARLAQAINRETATMG